MQERQATPRWYSGDYELDDSGEGDGEEADSAPIGPGTPRLLATRELTLDGAGAILATLDKLPKVSTPLNVQAELEYNDPNVEVLTSSTRIPLWPANLVVGLKPDAWAASKEKIRFHAVALGLDGKPRANVLIKLDLLERKNSSHRKQLIGGFYAYESYTEVKRLKDACSGKSDAKGLLICEFSSPVSGNVVGRGQVTDSAGNSIFAHQDVWVAGKQDWWFDVSNDDRMDVLPERKRYEPNETAARYMRGRVALRSSRVLRPTPRWGSSLRFSD